MIFRRNTEDRNDYDLDKEALKLALSEKIAKTKSGASKFRHNFEEDIHRAKKLAKKRTKLLYNIALKAAHKSSNENQNESESIHRKIKNAYDKSKKTFK